ncbi:MAG: hypothetical protein U0W24_12410 [Bacteroidales bacterium]
MIRALFVSLLFFLVACGNNDGNKESSLRQSDTIQFPKMTVSQLDSNLETIPYFNKKVIYGDSICQENQNYNTTRFDIYIFNNINQIDSLKELFGQSMNLKIIGKGRSNNCCNRLFALRDWGEWFCTFELLVFNKKWDLTGCEIIAGIGGEDGYTSSAYCNFINDSEIEMTWISENKYFASDDTENKIDSTIVETRVTNIKINNNGSISNEELKYFKKKL